MITGKYRMMKNKRELFFKQKDGQVFPVFTYLMVNNLSCRHMMLLFEKNDTF